ncbi:MAG: HEPN domain-containing protein [Bacteroidales bacterium]|nr:HEPN domain-containing protein [Bacteroidales bacterium]
MKKNNLILAKEWIKKADDDYKSAKVVLTEGGYLGTTCFLSQQMSEKYLKGYLVFSGKNVEKIHDLIKLLNECKKIKYEFVKLENECILLNDYYIETRYPLDTPINYTKKEAKEALIAAKSVRGYVVGLIDLD